MSFTFASLSSSDDGLHVFFLLRLKTLWPLYFPHPMISVHCFGHTLVSHELHKSKPIQNDSNLFNTHLPCHTETALHFVIHNYIHLGHSAHTSHTSHFNEIELVGLLFHLTPNFRSVCDRCHNHSPHNALFTSIFTFLAIYICFNASKLFIRSSTPLQTSTPTGRTT